MKTQCVIPWIEVMMIAPYMLTPRLVRKYTCGKLEPGSGLGASVSLVYGGDSSAVT